jgi:hypothetical protein
MNREKSSGMTPAAVLALVKGDKGNFMAASLPGGIEAMEAAGQAELTAHADRLPIEGTVAARLYGPQDPDAIRKQWEAAGFVFGERIKERSQNDREVFVACTFPKGWKLVPTNHSMWSDVIDAKGRRRAEVFFKAAFYDYHAHTFGLEARYSVNVREDADNGKGPYKVGVWDGAESKFILVEHEWPNYEASQSDDHRGDLKSAAMARSEAWLAANFPDFKNPLAYWE